MDCTVFYFTATGNSLFAAKQLDADCVSIAQAIHDRHKRYKAEKIGIVCPVYGHEVPAIVSEFISSAVFETPYFYMLLTFGNRHGNASELAEKLLEKNGIHPSYINVILMADNYLPSFNMDEQKKLDKNVDGQLEAIQNDIRACRNYIAPVTEKDRAAHREYLEKRARMPESIFSNLYHITDDCIGCEICTKVCPEQCFSMNGHRSEWHPDRCICCMACIHACPMMAVQLNIPEKNPKARYRNEHISICDIVDANNQLHPKK